jgi:hypothetical protein
MKTIHIRTTLESDTLHLPELRDLIGKAVEIIIRDASSAGTVRDQSHAEGALMDEATRHAWVQQLGREMSQISETCYCAGWLVGTEYLVPELCRRAVESGQTQYWGHGEVLPVQALRLWELAERIGCWTNVDTASLGYVPFQPFPIPPKYVEDIDREQAYELTRRGRDELA